eukprot:2865597-Prymnesium_polylepis.2
MKHKSSSAALGGPPSHAGRPSTSTKSRSTSPFGSGCFRVCQQLTNPNTPLKAGGEPRTATTCSSFGGTWSSPCDGSGRPSLTRSRRKPTRTNASCANA